MTRPHRRLRKPGKFQKKLFFQFVRVIFLFAIFILLISWLISRFGLSRHIIQNPISAFILIGLLSLILSSVSYWLFMQRISAPLREMNHLFRRVADGDFSAQAKRNSQIEEIDRCIQNLNRMIESLRSVEMLRSDFVTNVSHEFKTPLSSIIGYATLLQDDTLTPNERDEYVKKVLFHAEKLSRLSEDILLLSKLENQPTDGEEIYRLDEQLREAIVLLEEKWTEKEIDFAIEFAPITWRGPKNLLFHVWFNLFSNAIKFSDLGGNIATALSLCGEEIRFSVSDEGIGMSDEVQAHLFEKFYQGDTSHKSEGNGLGLALCQEIVQRVGGHIYVTSSLGKGSVFMVTLPRR